MSKVGVILLGQAPDPVFESALAAALGPDVELVVRGSMDGIPVEDLRQRPTPGPDVAVSTPFPDGSVVTLDKTEVARRVPAILDELRSQGVQVTLMACTTEWPELDGCQGLVQPGRIEVAVASALIPGQNGRIGVCLPNAERLPHQITPWTRGSWEVAGEALPSEADDAEVRRVAERLAAQHPDVVVLDCLYYTSRVKNLVAEVTGVPTLLPTVLAGRVLREMVM